ncbi:hypothetical protein PoB_006006000 [Plakobranchus ocellatus]|uniref:Uncharacterized protein n=1 Tax=Plakobranchus ocellatus TaxID=259542 RepID=A0AAV4CNU9_9GAST|nr:hypothetical protein PoB_006006000 [Plakobranchus ocellatus]
MVPCLCHIDPLLLSDRPVFGLRRGRYNRQKVDGACSGTALVLFDQFDRATPNNDTAKRRGSMLRQVRLQCYHSTENQPQWFNVKREHHSETLNQRAVSCLTKTHKTRYDQYHRCSDDTRASQPCMALCESRQKLLVWMRCSSVDRRLADRAPGVVVEYQRRRIFALYQGESANH